MKFGLVANAKVNLSPHLVENLKNMDVVIAADGGADQCRNHSILPGLIVGDFDSIQPETLKFFSDQEVRMQRHPAHKEKTDLELGFEAALQEGATEIHLFAWADERVDYNFETLNFLSRSTIPCFAYGNGYQAFILNEYQPSREFASQAGQKISILPLAKPVSLQTKGLRWELSWSEKSVVVGSQSNEAVSSSFFIRLQKGSCFVLVEQASSAGYPTK